MSREQDIAWAAGLFEGEGCFNLAQGKPRACMWTTDHDVLVRFAEIVGGRITGPHRLNHFGRKPIWRWEMYGAGRIVAFIRAMKPHLGERRLAKALEVEEAAWKIVGRAVIRSTRNRPKKDGNVIVGKAAMARLRDAVEETETGVAA